MNLLIVPWPEILFASRFKEIPEDDHPAEVAPEYGLFRVDTPESDEDIENLTAKFKRIIESAQLSIGRIDAVVLPEASLTLKAYQSIRDLAMSSGIIVIAGVYESTSQQPINTNSVYLAFPQGTSNRPSEYQQFKHHRWLLDQSQIASYGIASQLNPNQKWWEGIEIRDRKLNFFAIEDWLTMAVLICEDLARQDPVSQMLRTVGPNLVIALLMDGPQLKTRWPNRYAAVLADDPGCAVLSLTSIGMCTFNRPVNYQNPSRVVALWKDDRNGAVEIELPRDASALVLSLYNEEIEEFSADGRLDDYKSTRILLGGIHHVRQQ